MLFETHRMICIANDYESGFLRGLWAIQHRWRKITRVRKKRELDGLLTRDREQNMLFEQLYENNVSGKIDYTRSAKMSKRYKRARTPDRLRCCGCSKKAGR